MEQMGLPSWDEFFPVGTLLDARLRKRAVYIGKAITERPGLPFTGIFDDRSDVKAAYRLVENERMSASVLMSAEIAAMGEQVMNWNLEEPVLCIQDTTELDFTRQPGIEGLGLLTGEKTRGLFLHTGLAVLPEGVPVGILSVQTWVRPDEPKRKSRKRKKLPFDKKESVKWWKGILQAEAAVKSPDRLIHVSDRESDIYELFLRCQEPGYRLLVRATQDRSIEGEHKHLWSEALSWPELDSQLIHVPARQAHENFPAQTDRITSLAIRFGQVRVKSPDGKGEPVPMTVLLAREVNPPSEKERVEWLLLTNDPIETVPQAWQYVQWYRFRWIIEEFHKCLKTGCKVEERQFDSRERLEVALALLMLAAVKILQMTKLARVDVTSPSQCPSASRPGCPPEG